MVFKFYSPDDLLKTVAARAKAKRLAANLIRRSLSARSDVTEPSIKRFETTGQISFQSLLKLAHALDCLQEFEPLFVEDAPRSISELQSKPKQRGSL